MAPKDSLYVPELSKVFEGEAYVFSWAETAASIQTNRDYDIPNHVQSWLKQDAPSQILLKGAPSFSKPNPASEKQFSTQTAPINISPSQTEHYDVAEIRSLTTWLSKELDLDEVQALRSVMLEWQQRPQAHLESGYSDSELACLRNVFGDNVAADGDDWASSVRRDDDQFHTEVARKRRVLLVHLREELGLIDTYLALAEKGYYISQLGHSQSIPVDVVPHTDECLGKLVTTLEETLQNAKLSTVDEDSISLWYASRWFLATVLMKLVLLCVRQSTRPSNVALQSWLRLMLEARFLADLEPSPLLSPDQVFTIQSLVSLTTIASIDPATTIGAISDPPSDFWLKDTELVADLHSALFHGVEKGIMPTVTPAFTWAIVLAQIYAANHTAKDSQENRHSRRAIEGTDTYDAAYGARNSTSSLSAPFEDVINAIWQISSMQNPAEYLTKCTLDVYDAHMQLGAMSHLSQETATVVSRTIVSQIVQEVVLTYLDLEGYDDKILAPQLAILTPPYPTYDRSIDLVAPAKTFLYNNTLREQMFELSAARFPYEALPFLRLCRTLAYADVFDPEGNQFIAVRLKTLTSYTSLATSNFASYHTIREDENMNLVALSAHVDALPQTSTRLLTNGQRQNAALILPAETVGEVISDTHPPVIRWQHQLPGLVLLGQWIQLYFDGVLQPVLSKWDMSDDVAAEIIWVFSALIETTLNRPDCQLVAQQEIATAILSDASVNLPQGRDLTMFVFDILEQQLQAYQRRPSSIFDTNLICACFSYFQALLLVEPDKIWLSLSKTSLLDNSSRGGLLTMIISGVEQFSGSTALVEAAQALHGALVQSAFATSSRKSVPVSTPLLSHSRLPQMTALKTCSNVLVSMTRAMLDTFEFLPVWQAVPQQTKARILQSVCETFYRVLVICDTGDDDATLSRCMLPSAEAVISRLQPGSLADTKASAIVRQLSLYVRPERYFRPSLGLEFHVASLFTLTNSVICFSRKLEPTATPLEVMLLDSISVLVRRLTPVSVASAAPTFHLLNTLLSDGDPQRQPSLLGHLGQSSCIDFVNVLLEFERKHDAEIATHAWRTLKFCIDRRQQWLAVVILTGSIPEKPKGISKSESGGQMYRGKLVVDRAADLLLKIADLDSGLMVAVLGLVQQMQQNWSWTLDTLRDRQSVFTSLVTFATGSASTRLHDEIQQSQHYHLVSLITDLASMHLHYAKSKRDVSMMKTFIPLLEWLTKHAISVGGYNQSLHDNLRKNFAAKFGFELGNFKTSRLLAPTQSRPGYYDMNMLDQVLVHQTSWSLPASKSQQSFSAEVRRANRNLAVVETELSLLRAFERFCIEHCAFFVQSQDLQVTMAHIIQRCLEANTQQRLTEQIFEHLFQTRADIALTLIRPLAEKRPKGSDYRNLLATAWNCAKARNNSWAEAIDNDDLDYWRTLMSVILLALQFHLGRSWQPLATGTTSGNMLHHTEHSISQVLEIATTVVGQGIETLVLNLQDQYEINKEKSEQKIKTSVGSKDVALVVNIFQTILRQARLPDFASQLSERLIGTGCIQSALLLYSWSHLLVTSESGNEPIYADYATQILLSLSALPAVAEELAVEGALGRILTARVTQVMQKVPGGVSPLDQRPHTMLLYRVWAEGLLPICLNLLHSVAAPVAAEVTVFLNQFPYQLSRAAHSLQPQPGPFLTLSMAREASTLAIISYIIERYREAGASAAVDPDTLERLMGYEEHQKALREDIRELTSLTDQSLATKIVRTNEQEVQWAKTDELRKRVQNELKAALTCMTREEVEGDKSQG